MLWLLASSVCSKIQSKHEIELNQSKSEEKHMPLNMYRSLFQKCISKSVYHVHQIILHSGSVWCRKYQLCTGCIRSRVSSQRRLVELYQSLDPALVRSGLNVPQKLSNQASGSVLTMSAKCLLGSVSKSL